MFDSGNQIVSNEYEVEEGWIPEDLNKVTRESESERVVCSDVVVA